MLVFGLTGGVASGKSTVAQYWASLGLPIVDADELARKAVVAGSAGLRAIVAEFGQSVLAADGSLRRDTLASVVFGDSAKLQRLNAIVHPEVAALATSRFASLEASGEELCCYDVPLLFENGLEKHLRPVVVVHVDLRTQLARARKRSGWSETETRRRIDAQMPLAQKVRQADLTIDNGGSLASTHQQALFVLEMLRAKTNAVRPKSQT